MSVGALEPQFYEVLVDLLGIREAAPDRYDVDRADELRAVIAGRFREKTQAEWSAVFDGTDACVAPILPLREAVDAPAPVKERARFVEKDGLVQPRTGPALLPHPGEPRPAAGDGSRSPAPGGAGRVGDRRHRRLIESGAAVQA